MSAPLSKNYAERIRTQLGLRHDHAYIQELAAQADLNVREIGTPITDEELADLQQRQALVVYVPSVETLLSGDLNYAGIWFDRIPGGGVRIALTGEPTPQQTEAVARCLPAGAKVTYVNVRYTRAELQSLADAIVQECMGGVRRKGPPVNGVSVNQKANAVDVRCRSEQDLAAFVKRFGSDPRIKTRVGQSRTSGRGGSAAI